MTTKQIPPDSRDGRGGESAEKKETMDFQGLVRSVHYPSGTFVILRPSISLWLTYSEPIQTLCPYIADVLEAFLDFVGHDKLSSYLSGNGAWRPLSSRVLNRDLKEMRAIPANYEHVEYHYEGPDLGSVGEFGFHFFGSHLGQRLFPLEENLLILHFPVVIFEERPAEELVNFVSSIAGGHAFGSGAAGYGFHHLYLTHRDEALSEVVSLSSRYLGFDINSDDARRASRGQVYNTSWITLFGTDLVSSLGGESDLLTRLPSAVAMTKLGTGVLLRLGERPAIGDIKHGADDIGEYRSVAAITKALRVNGAKVRPTLECTPQWLERLDP